MDISRMRFLVVEDHGFQRWEMGKLLEDLGATKVFSAGDGRDALTLIQDLHEPIDIVITDLDMPEMDGLEFMQHVGASAAGTAVIVVTALKPEVIAEIGGAIRDSGVRLLGVLEKPMTRQRLADALAAFDATTPTGARRKHDVALASAEDIAAGLHHGEFVALFQPKVDLQSRRIAGAEALARWRRADGTLLAPAAFLPAMRDARLIDELTTTMLARAADATKLWRKAGLDIPVAVNLFPRSLQSTDFAERMIEVARSHAVAPQGFVLETTEAALNSNASEVLENLTRLRMAGFGLSIDGYGHITADAAQLARMALTEIKLHPALLRTLPPPAAERDRINIAIANARRFHLAVVAGGIETEAQWNAMRDLGCNFGQGFYIAMPLMPDNLLLWAAIWRRSAARE